MTYAELKAILERAGKHGVRLFGAQRPSARRQLIRSSGTQTRKVTRRGIDTNLRTIEPVRAGYSTALIGGALQTVKI